MNSRSTAERLRQLEEKKKEREKAERELIDLKKDKIFITLKIIGCTPEQAHNALKNASPKAKEILKTHALAFTKGQRGQISVKEAMEILSKY